MRWTLLTAALSLGLLAPAGALASGGPVQPVQGSSSIRALGSPFWYAAFGSGGDTIVKRLTGAGGQSGAALRVSGHYGIPGVDYSGSMTGLSANGRTLVLAEVSSSGVPRTTRLLVLDTPRLAVRTRLALPGWSTVDAISPDGRWLYLIHYLSSDVTRYEVRAYDLVDHLLLAKPVVDPQVPAARAPHQDVLRAGARPARASLGERCTCSPTRPRPCPIGHSWTCSLCPPTSRRMSPASQVLERSIRRTTPPPPGG